MRSELFQLFHNENFKIQLNAFLLQFEITKKKSFQLYLATGTHTFFIDKHLDGSQR